MEENINSEDIKVLLSNFNKKYHKVLTELDALYKGSFHESEGDSAGALCLIAQASLLESLGSADLRARSLKRDIEFAKAKAYKELKDNPPNGKKLAVTEAPTLLAADPEVQKLSKEQNEAEKEAKELNNILLILRDAHILFRNIGKKG